MTTEASVNKPERMKRGSFPPYLSLGEAFDLTRAIYEQGGGQASYDLVSRLTGNSSSSSSFIRKTGALKLYGLVTEQNGNLILTEQGSAIAAPISEGAEVGAKKAAFLGVPAYTRLFERHKGKLLPADEFLKNILEQDIGIPRELSSEWVLAFKESARAAGLLFSRPDGKIQILETPSFEVERTEGRSDFTDSTLSPATSIPEPMPRGSVPSNITAASPSVSGNNTRFDLSDGRVAEFRIPFGINSRDAKRLKSFLKGLELIIDSAVMNEEEPPS
jgi:hypothetical protein